MNCAAFTGHMHASLIWAHYTSVPRRDAHVVSFKDREKDGLTSASCLLRYVSPLPLSWESLSSNTEIKLFIYNSARPVIG